MDASHFVDIVRHNFEPGTSLAVVSTIQFVATLQVCKLLFYLIPSPCIAENKVNYYILSYIIIQWHG